MKIKVSARRSYFSELSLPTSDIRHPTSDIRHPTSDIRHPTSDIRHPTSDIRHPTSDIRHPTTSDIRHPTSDIRHPTSDIRYARASNNKNSINAFCACRRFSASSQITVLGLSMSSALISSPRLAGRQCIYRASGLAWAISALLIW